MTSYLYESKANKVIRIYDVLAATNAEVARLNALQVTSVSPAVWLAQENQLVILRERVIQYTRELAAANALP